MPEEEEPEEGEEDGEGAGGVFYNEPDAQDEGTLSLAFEGEAQELFDNVSGTPFSSDGVRPFVRRFKVLVDLDASECAPTPMKVCECVGLPAPYALHPEDQLAVHVNMSAAPEFKDDQKSWIVTCTYSTQVPAGGVPYYETKLGSFVEGTQNEPWLEPATHRWENVEEHRAPRKDLNGQAYLNSAGQAFTPAMQVPVNFMILVVTRNEQFFDRAATAAMNYATNSENFMDAAPETVLLLPVQTEVMERGTLRYWRRTYRFKFIDIVNDDNTYETWQPKVLDSGLNKLATVAGIPFQGQPVPIIGPGGVPYSTPRLLDGEGGLLSPADPADPAFTPVYLEFKNHQEMDFNDLFYDAENLDFNLPE